MSQVYVDAPARALDARCLADGVPLPPGESLWSERFAIDLCGDPNEQLERYGFSDAPSAGGGQQD